MNHHFQKCGCIKRRWVGLQFFVFLVILCSSWSGFAADTTNVDSGLIDFFKQAVDSPPDIQNYVAKRINLLLSSRSYTYVGGGLSGTNFVLQYLPDPEQPANSNIANTISVRYGSSIYEIGGHGIIYGVGENSLSVEIKTQYLMSRQILCMGAGEIEPGTVKWTGNDFIAKNHLGKDISGTLQVSNNLPFRLERSLVNTPHPYGVIEYSYPTPANALAGFPAQFVISLRDDSGKLNPIAEVDLKSIQMAKQPLDASYFSEARFAERISYTNVYSNADYYATRPKDNKLIKVNSLVRTGGFTNSHSRTLIYICLICATLFPASILLIWSVRKQ